MKLKIIFLIILIAGCSTETIEPLPQEEPLPPPPEEPPEPTQDVQVAATVQETGLPETSFTIEELESYLSEISGMNYKFQKQNQPEYVDFVDPGLIISDKTGNYWSIQMLGEDLTDIESFQKTVGEKDWEGWQYYINHTWWNFLTHPLSEKELEKVLPDYNFKKYKNTESEWVYHDIRQEPFMTSFGKIPRYRSDYWIVDTFNEWQGHWESPLLLYKVPCTKDIVLYFQPLWDSRKGVLYLDAQDKESVEENYQALIVEEEKNVKEIVEKAMGFCGIKEEMLEGYVPKTYKESETYVMNWKVFYKAKLKQSVEVQEIIFKEDDDEELNNIETITLTFTNLEDDFTYARDEWVYVKAVAVEPKGRARDYHTAWITVKEGKRPLEPGESLTVEYDPYFEDDFPRESTLNLTVHTDYYDIGSPVVLNLTEWIENE